MLVEGIDDLWMTLSTLKTTQSPSWTDADVAILFEYTDGYKITLSQTVAVQVTGS